MKFAILLFASLQLSYGASRLLTGQLEQSFGQDFSHVETFSQHLEQFYGNRISPNPYAGPRCGQDIACNQIEGCGDIFLVNKAMPGNYLQMVKDNLVVFKYSVTFQSPNCHNEFGQFMQTFENLSRTDDRWGRW